MMSVFLQATDKPVICVVTHTYNAARCLFRAWGTHAKCCAAHCLGLTSNNSEVMKRIIPHLQGFGENSANAVGSAVFSSSVLCSVMVAVP